MSNQSANQSYQTRRQNINTLMGRLQSMLKELDEQQAQEPGDWGFTGNLSVVEGNLVNSVKFLAGEND